jgi:hypothetical protein
VELPAPGGAKVTITHAYDAHPDEPTHIFVRGEERTPDRTTPITPGVPAALGGPALRIEPVHAEAAGPARSTGRRLALARWVADRQNPLTARVAVNHLWARHFGRPLVENVADFGRRTRPPALHPLLDWLAVEFTAHNWSMKWLHRLLVTSAAYRRQSSREGASAGNLAADPDNLCYWRMDPRRMEAEVVRDALLRLSGTLDPTLGGPPLDCLSGPDSPRRSLYHRYSREDKLEFLLTFDAPSVEECWDDEKEAVKFRPTANSSSKANSSRLACSSGRGKSSHSRRPRRRRPRRPLPRRKPRNRFPRSPTRPHQGQKRGRRATTAAEARSAAAGRPFPLASASRRHAPLPHPTG